MPSISSAGLGSGLDVNGLVSQLVAAERAPLQQRITRHEIDVTTSLSALGSLKGALAAFKAALEPLRSLDSFRARKATTGDEKIFTVSAGATAQPGSYSIEVVEIAKAHQLSSAGFVGGSAAVVGAGTLTLTLGTTSTAVTIDSTNNTLAGIVSAINAKSDNPGILATLVHGVDGSHLVLTSNKTGATNAIKVTQSGGDGGLSQLVYDPPTTTNLTELAPAQNASIRMQGVDGIEHSSPSNVITTAIDGVTITLKSKLPGTQVALDVAYDTATAADRVNKFVKEYNALQAQVARLRSYNPDTKAAGPMLGDPLLNGIESQIRRGLNDTISGLSGTYQSLASIGIKTTASGALEVDSAKLKTALESNFDAVGAIFASTEGVAARLYTQLEKRLASTAEVESRTTSLNGSLKQIAKDKVALDLRMAQIEARYRKQFTALDSLLSKLQSTSSYLAQQLANLPKVGG
jgi:flagellar hook-associated protein 2